MHPSGMHPTVLRVWKTVARLEYWLIAQLTFAMLGLARLLPARSAVELAAALGRRLGPRSSRNELVLENLRLAFPEKTEAEREEIARKSWRNMFRLGAEYVYLEKLFDYDPDAAEPGLIERLEAAEEEVLHPLRMRAFTAEGATQEVLAINEVSLLRQGPQAAKLRIQVDGRVRMDELVCDGALLATPAGSTAYNYSAHGPILPINAQMLALTPISAFRPRRWRGALLPHDAIIEFEALEAAKRPVSVVADNQEVRDVRHVEIRENRDIAITLLFDPGQSLDERILSEQFDY